MEKELNNDELALMELIESKSFDALNLKEQAFVLSLISKNEYEVQHDILKEVAHLEESTMARPLVLPTKKGFVVPLYQAIGGVAAAVVISFFVFKGDTYIYDSSESVQTARIDTLYIENTIVDTIIEYQKEYVDKIVVAQEKASSNVQLSENVSITSFVSTNDLPVTKNKAHSLATDEMFALVKDLRFN